jgi:phage host-nuclease inhibitor protein Gam
MAKTRVTKKVVANISREAFEDALSAYAVADAKEKTILAKMDEQITKIREKYADELTDLQEQKTETYEVAYTYCNENSELFAKKKSMETAHGTVGFRTGTPKLKTLKGFTWASVLTLLKKTLPAYVRVKEEPNKELLLADREKPEIKVALAGVGIAVDQDETFFIDLKKEEAVGI